MKKVLALVLAVIMLCAAWSALAEEDGKPEPLYATVADALEEAGEHPIRGVQNGYCIIITQRDGKFYRSFAELDDRARELDEAISNADIDHLMEAFEAAEAYEMTLPISYSEMFTVEPMSQEEMDALVGKTIAELREAGFEDRETGPEGDQIVFVMRNGLFEYACVVDTDVDGYMKATEEETDGTLVITAVTLWGMTSDAFESRVHTDGTIEEPQDPFADLTEIMASLGELVEKIQSGEEADIHAWSDEMKEKYPDEAEMIDQFVSIYDTYGAEMLVMMISAPAEAEQ